MTHTALKPVLAPLALLSLHLVSTIATNGVFTLDTATREKINDQIFSRVENGQGKKVWVATREEPTMDAKDKKAYGMFDNLRSAFEGLGMYASMRQPEAFPFVPLFGEELEKHLEPLKVTENSYRFDANKETWVLIHQEGSGNSDNGVVDFFNLWIQGAQVVMYQTRPYTKTEQDAKNLKDDQDKNNDKKRVNTLRKLEAAKRIDKRIKALLDLMKRHGVPVFQQQTGLKEKDIPDLEIELELFKPFNKIKGAVNALAGQGQEGSAIYPKVHVGIELYLHFISKGINSWEVDVVSFGANFNLPEDIDTKSTEEQNALKADKARVWPNPTGVSPVLGFTKKAVENTAQVKSHHVVIPAFVDEFLAKLEKEKGLPKDSAPPPGLVIKKIVVDITDEKAMQLLDEPDLYSNLDMLRELAKYITTSVTEITT